jgi:hypothetical protein
LFVALGLSRRNHHLSLFGVLDGHGINGGDVAKFVKEHMMSALNASPYRNIARAPHETFAQAFDRVAEELKVFFLKKKKTLIEFYYIVFFVIIFIGKSMLFCLFELRVFPIAPPHSVDTNTFHCISDLSTFPS